MQLSKKKQVSISQLTHVITTYYTVRNEIETIVTQTDRNYPLNWIEMYQEFKRPREP